MAQAAGKEGHLHILAVPFQQEGHIAGMLKLVQAFSAQDGVLITFAYPARAHGFALKHNKLPCPLSYPSLRIEVVNDGLPLDNEQTFTHELVRDSMAIFQGAVRLLLDALLHPSQPSHLPPLCCILSDTFQPWTQALATAVALPRVEYWPSSATMFCMGTQFPRLVSNGTLPLPESSWLNVEKKWSAKAPLIDCVPGVPPFPPTDYPPECVEPDVSDFRLQFFKAAFECTREAHTIVVHSIYELERQVFDALQAIGLPVLAIGPIQLIPAVTQPSACNGTPKSILSDKDKCIQWLDTQRPASVIFVALGSMAIFSPAETHSLAHALEASELPFIWVIREDSLSGSLSDVLPEGFLQRTVEKGVGLIVAWAPQTQVLSHQSTAAFFTHCGWNSCLESMWDGVPVLACPRAAEQRANERLLVEKWKMGVELERQNDGSFTKEGVQRALKEVFNVAYKENALHVKKVWRATVQKGGTSDANLGVLLQRLRQL